MNKLLDLVQGVDGLPVDAGGSHEVRAATSPSTIVWHLEAVRRVRMMMGRGYRRLAAQEEMAQHLSCTVKNLQDWERELVKSSDYENDLICAELVGEFHDYFVSGHYTNIDQYKAYGSYDGQLNIARAAGIAKATRNLSFGQIRSGLRARVQHDSRL